MSSSDNEEELLRSVALQNARAVLLARERAEKSLLEAKKELERKNQDLFEQREWFKVTLSSIGDGVITTDSRGVLTFLNPVAEELTGWKAAEAIGLPLETVFVILNEQTQQPAQNPVFKTLRDGTVVSLANHTVLVRRDGTRVPIEDSAAPIRNYEGVISGAVMVFHDVTERRQKDEVLRRLAAVIESSDDAILTMSLEAIITTWNAGAERMYGYKAMEIVGKSVNTLIPPGRADEEPELLERLKRGERIEHYETVRRTKLGVDLHVSLTVSPIMDSMGRIVGVSKIARDITRRTRDEEALRRSESELRSLANSIPQLAWMARPDGHVFWYNRRWFEYTGTTLEQMEGWGWQSFHDPAILPQVVERWRESIRTGEPFNMEFPLRGADGQFRWFLTRINALRDQEGRVLRWFGTNTDVDEVRRAREALREAQAKLSLYMEDLEKQVEERTAALRGKVAELEAFSYSVSHDLRAPLRAIQSYSLILAEECGPRISSQQKEYLRRMDSAAERMDLLIQDVLSYSRTSRTAVALKPIDLGTLLRGVVESYPSFQPPSAIIELREPLPEVLGADALLTQCVSNILGNAVKFVARGVTPHVRVWAETADGCGTVKIFFKDNGLGIPAEAHQRIFGIFERISNDYEGTGIGLSIVKKGVEMLGGAVGLESEPGKRINFLAGTKTAQAGTNMTDIRPILYAEDDANDAFFVQRAFKLAEIANPLCIVPTGQDAIDYLAGAGKYSNRPESPEPCLVLLDLKMPLKSGLEVLEWIRSGQGPSITVLMLTSSNQASDIDRAYALGANGYLVKPGKPTELLAIVRGIKQFWLSRE